MDDSLWRVVSIKINWWLRETSWVLFLPFKDNWHGSVVMVRWWPSPGAAKHPCQIPAQPLSSFSPIWLVLGQTMEGWLYPVFWDVFCWGLQALGAVSQWSGRSLARTCCHRSLGQDLTP